MINSKGKFTAYVVYSGTGDNYEKHAVFNSNDAAQSFANLGPRDFRVWKVKVDSKHELENIVEDNLTDDEASLYTNNG